MEQRHFKRAAVDVGVNGDNDTLPFDLDIRFVKERQDLLAELAHKCFSSLESMSKDTVRHTVNSLEVFSERLLTPAGPAGFRITTKIHPFWNVYINGLAVAIAEKLEPFRSPRAHSYRFVGDGAKLFDLRRSWRAFREACVAECEASSGDLYVVQTDISSFYEHIYHHRIEGFLNGLFPEAPKLAIQLDRFLSKLASGRSFGLPVGGQCSRVLAELVMQVVDTALTDHGVKWHRYVDDFVLITTSQAEAYQAVATLSNVLADLGLTLNKSKTTILSGRHFIDYVRTQLGSDEDPATSNLKEIDLRFDPYSDTALEDYTALRGLVEHIDLQKLLKLELEKSVPDTFLVAQIGRTLRYQEPAIALKLVEALLAPANLHAFRASWSTIMRGIAAVRDDEQFETIFEGIDSLLDEVATHSSHLLTVDTSCLHYLRALRYRKTEKRAQFVSLLYRSTQSVMIKRACIDCWRIWKDFAAFMQVRNRWQVISPEEQRMLWLCSKSFDDDGKNFRSQEKRSALRYWALGVAASYEQEFAEAFIDWAQSWS